MKRFPCILFVFLLAVSSGCSAVRVKQKYSGTGEVKINLTLYSLQERKEPECRVLLRDACSNIIEIPTQLITEGWGHTEEFGKAVIFKSSISKTVETGGYELLIMIGLGWRSPTLDYIVVCPNDTIIKDLRFVLP